MGGLNTYNKDLIMPIFNSPLTPLPPYPPPKGPYDLKEGKAHHSHNNKPQQNYQDPVMEPLWSLIVGIMDIFEGSLGGQGSRRFCKPYKSLIKSLPNRLTKPFTESYKTLDGLSGLLSNQGEKSINFFS